jgi:hypothetical protein
MVVAIVALVSSFAGPAIAGPVVELAKKATFNGSKIKNRSISGVKLKNNTITGTQVNEGKLGKVPKAASADSAGSATTAGNADKLDGVDSTGFLKQGDSAPPLAYAKVNDDGSLDTANSKNVIDSTLGTNPGRYCFKLGFTPKSMIASAERFVGSPNGVIAQPAVTASITAVCPAGFQDAGVLMFDNAGTLINNRFFIIFN